MRSNSTRDMPDFRRYSYGGSFAPSRRKSQLSRNSVIVTGNDVVWHRPIASSTPITRPSTAATVTSGRQSSVGLASAGSASLAWQKFEEQIKSIDISKKPGSGSRLPAYRPPSAHFQKAMDDILAEKRMKQSLKPPTCAVGISFALEDLDRKTNGNSDKKYDFRRRQSLPFLSRRTSTTTITKDDLLRLRELNRTAADPPTAPTPSVSRSEPKVDSTVVSDQRKVRLEFYSKYIERPNSWMDGLTEEGRRIAEEIVINRNKYSRSPARRGRRKLAATATTTTTILTTTTTSPPQLQHLHR